ncbi:iron transporter [Stomatobaculum longum]|jgi:pathogen-specific surface antigen|uniref:iron transporter n=1 Tax=Stomatobaculum longum TaxID=796942 RepID=UPI0028E84360|nr:iron transporter [Stomatobaculum longum]
MMKRSLALSMLIAAVALSACGGSKSAETKASGSATESSAETKAGETTAAMGETKMEETKAEAKAPGEDAGFEEFPIGDDQEVGPLIISGVYFQPVDMEPAGNSLSKADSDCHIEADITASQEGTTLGYGKGDFVPWLQVKAIIQKKGSDKEPTEVAFMPMNASDGPHYGANFKFPEGVGVYDVKFVVSAPGNDYLLHVDKETGVTGRFWTEPLVAEWPDFEWNGPQW